nr:MAG TPA: hypothetical protein [Caudoviricetes sp.]
MGRKNRRRKHKPPMPPWAREPVTPKVRSRCAFCGRLLDEGDYYWFPDEYGQFVRKCKNERDCSAHRRRAAEDAFRRAYKGR